MVDRRAFLKAAAIAGTAFICRPIRTLDAYAQQSLPFFGVHPFIEHNPDAVFIVRTQVARKTDSAAIKQIGMDFGRSVFARIDDAQTGIPLTHNIAIKPNMTCLGKWEKGYTAEGTMGVVTDAHFVEGVIESLKECGFAGNQCYLREVNCPEESKENGYWNLAKRTGADLRNLSAPVGEISDSDLQWMDAPDGVWFRKIPYLFPINAPDTWLLNIAKFKAHAMGMTLCAKNLQGTIAHNYQAHCRPMMDIAPEHVQPRASKIIREHYARHTAAKIPRWDKPGDQGGLWQETWATRCVDNNAVTHAGLHIIEGIYGRDGHFVSGPNPQGFASDYMTNLIIFGKNPWYVDMIGVWLAGHEPGNFGLFHLASERGMASVIAPMEIPVYEWRTDGTAQRMKLTDFERTPLKTCYLQKNYGGANEPFWHLVNEPYDYPAKRAEHHLPSQRPSSAVLHYSHPQSRSSSAAIELNIPNNGHTRLDIFNAAGDVVDVPWERYAEPGKHLVVWNAEHHPAGPYFYRFQYEGFRDEMTLLSFLK